MRVRTLERQIRAQKLPKVLKFVIIYFPVFWLSAVVAETRRILVSFRRLYFHELKIKNVEVTYLQCETAGLPD